jgi:8-oxo-dGTP diphosphatase
VGHPRLAVDGVAAVDGKLVTVVRGKPPFLGIHALPGGAVELGETTEAAVVREIEEETGLRVRVARLVGVYSEPDRDPRGHTISVAYEVRPIGGRLAAGSDAADVDLVDPTDLPEMAFDHARIVADFLAAGNGPARVPPRAVARPASPSPGSSRRGRGGRKRARTGRGRPE